jgi:predicted nucleic-acid-binding protein
MRDLLGVEYIEFEALEVVGKALAAFEGGSADFADVVIALRNRDLGVPNTFTFDERAAKSVPGMELLA